MLLHRLDTQYVQQNILISLVQNIKPMIIKIIIHDYRFDIRHWAQTPQLGPFHNLLMLSQYSRSCFFYTSSPSSSPLGSRSVPKLGFSLPFVWSLLSCFLVIIKTVCSPSSDTRRPSTVLEAVDVPYPGTLHFIFLTLLIISTTFVVCLAQMLVFLTLYVILVSASFFCACLVSVQVFAP